MVAGLGDEEDSRNSRCKVKSVPCIYFHDGKNTACSDRQLDDTLERRSCANLSERIPDLSASGIPIWVPLLLVAGT